MSKNIVITGASGNLGDAAVKKFSTSGFHVIAVSNSKPVQNTSAEIDSRQVDLTDDSAVKNFVDSLILKYKSIDAVLLLAGGFAPGKIEMTSPEDLGKMFSVNFKTAFYLTKYLLPHFNKNNSGKIIFTGSVPGMDAASSTGAAAYGLSKSLLFHLAKMINGKSETNNVRAYVIVPSTMDTPQNRAAMPDADFSKWLKTETIAEKLFQLCSNSPMIDSERIIIEFA